MALTYANLITEVQMELGKSGDTALCTSARALRFINKAVRDIIMEWPGLRDVTLLDKTTWKCVADQYEYQLSDFADHPICHLIRLRYISLTNTDYGRISPFVGGPDEWDNIYPYIPDLNTGIPKEYVRRGNTVEFCPMPGTDEADAALWMEHDYLPREVTDTASTDTLPLTNFDEEVIQTAKAYGIRLLSLNNSSLTIQAREAEQFARTLVEDRVRGEADFDEIDQVVDHGP